MFTKKQVWALIIPLMIEQVLNALMGAADTMMVSNAGSAAISAVSLVDSINILVLYVFTAMATGGTIVCSQYIGHRDEDMACQAGKQLVLSVTALSVVVTVLCLVLRRPLLSLIFGSVEAEVMANSLTYFFITALSYPFIALYNSGAALFRTCGNSRLPLAISTVANLINVIGNAVFIFGFHMGVAGAALATLISRVICAVAVMICLRRPTQAIVVKDYLSIRPNMRLIRRIMAIGIPTGIENGMFQFGKLAIQSTVSTLATYEIAAQAMTSTLEMMTSNASIGVGLAMVTIVGQCVGAWKLDEAKHYIKRLTWYGEAGIIVSCAIIAAAVKPITVLGGMEPAAAELCIKLTWLICIVKPILWAFAFMPPYGLRAAGDVKFTMIFSISSMWLCRVILAIVLVRVFHMGLLAVWIAMFIDWALRALVYTVRLRGKKWIHKAAIED